MAMLHANLRLVLLACTIALSQAQSSWLQARACRGKSEGAKCAWVYRSRARAVVAVRGTCQSGKCITGGSNGKASDGTGSATDSSGKASDGTGSAAGSSGTGRSQRLTDAELAAFRWTRRGRQTNKLNEDLGVDGRVSITKSADGTSLIITSNGIPEHDAGYDLTPMSMKAQNYTYTVPVDPELTSSDSSDSAGCLPYSPIGLTLAGVPIFSAFTATLKTSDGQVVQNTCCDPVAEEVDLVDNCLGHGSPYHYHALTKCVLPDVECGAEGQLLGIMFDGIGIYTPADTDGTPITASQLDRCGGMTGKDGRYRYHITKQYPHTIGCFRGTVRAPEMMSKCACEEQGNKPHDTCPYKTSAKRASACTLCANAKCIADKHDNTCDATCQACKSTGACAMYCGADATVKTITPWKVIDRADQESNEDAMYCSGARRMNSVFL